MEDIVSGGIVSKEKEEGQDERLNELEKGKVHGYGKSSVSLCIPLTTKQNIKTKFGFKF